MNDPVLLELFTCLRKAGFPLGLAEYYLLLQAIDAGFGSRDRDALAHLCRTLWVKSQREEQVFQSYFDQIIPQQPESIFVQNEAERLFSKDINLTTSLTDQVTLRKQKAFRILRFLVLGVTACGVAIGSIFLIRNYIFPIDPLQPGNLEFSSSSSIFKYSTIRGEKVAHIKITRSIGSYGTVSAKLNLDEQCPSYVGLDKENKKFQLGNLPLVVFKDGQARERPFPIHILNVNNINSPDETFILCLTDPQGGVKIGRQDQATLLIQDLDYFYDLVKRIFHADILEPLLIISTCIFFLFVAWKIWKIRYTRTSGNEALLPGTYTNLPKRVMSPEVMRVMANEIQVARTIGQSDHQLNELFPLIVNDLPVTHRQMKQGWRCLRQFIREGPSTELDLEATIQQVAQRGTLLSPVLVPRRTNRLELLLLIDRDGSMVPFHHLAQELADTAERGGRFSRVRVYYFHNCPDEYLYRDPYHLEAEPLDDCLSSLPKARTVCLIFSDAGAARGGFSSKRRRLTKFFLKGLRRYVRYMVWINPVPHQRWEATTAYDIQTLVPMFEFNRQGFYSAIDILRGRYLPLKEVFR